MRALALIALLSLLTGCAESDPDLRQIDGRTLWTASGCAYTVQYDGLSNKAEIRRSIDADKPTCQEAPHDD